MQLENSKEKLLSLYNELKDFKNSSFYITGAQSIVFGEGNCNSPIMFIGEAPGEKEDITGKPFVGRAGTLLTQTLESYNIKRENVFITNIVKCRPPHNRPPTTNEIVIGKKLLIQEIAIIKPQLIVTLGASSLKGLYADYKSMNKVRGTIINTEYGVIFPCYHPAYILRNPSARDIFDSDIVKALTHVGLL